MDILKTESYRKGIAFSTALNVVARLLSFLNNVTIAFYFGANASTDVYFYVIGAVFLLTGFITGFSQSILIPESMRIRKQDGEKQAMKFLNFFFLLFFIMAAAVSLVLLLHPVKFFSLLSGFDVQVLIRHGDTLLMAVPLILLMVMVTFLTDVLTSYKYFTLPMIASMINSFFSIVFIVLFHGRMNVQSVVLGLLCAHSINLVLLIAILKNRCAWSFTFSFFPVAPKTVKDIFYAQAGNLATTLSSYVPMYLLSGIGAGVIATLNFGRMAAELPSQVITKQFSAVTGIRFNELHAQGEEQAFSETFLRTARFLIFILIPVSGMMWLFSEEILTLLFKRGAFDSRSVEDSAAFLRLFTLSVSLAGIDTLVARMYMAAKKIKQSFIYQVIFNVFSIGLLFVLVRPYGQLAYPLSVFVCYALNLFVQFFYLRRVIPYIRYGRILPYFFLVLAINVAVASVTFAAVRFPGIHQFPVRAVAGCLLYSLCILTINAVFRINHDLSAILCRVFRVRKAC
jgi:peptidoglycan biosynthesis protein MviN/MurJ (putative lipid II flippase)